MSWPGQRLRREPLEMIAADGVFWGVLGCSFVAFRRGSFNARREVFNEPSLLAEAYGRREGKVGGKIGGRRPFPFFIPLPAGEGRVRAKTDRREHTVFALTLILSQRERR
jgi:hypothetical protein